MAPTLALRMYVQFARCAFQRRAAYRLANWTGIAVNFFFFLIQAQVFLAFFRDRTVDGWQETDAVRYFATSESLLMVLGIMSTQAGLELAERVRSGDIAIDLARPLRLWPRFVAESYGAGAYYALMRATVLYVAAVLLYRLPLPLNPVVLVAPLSIALGIGVAALLMYLAGASAFWTEQAHGPLSLVLMALVFFGGVVVPLDFYPPTVRLVADLLPFRAAVYTPIVVASGKLGGLALVGALAHQVLWAIVLSVTAERVEQRGARHLAVQGG
jgi:viologen exporter family transport system permease protein